MKRNEQLHRLPSLYCPPPPRLLRMFLTQRPRSSCPFLHRLRTSPRLRSRIPILSGLIPRLLTLILFPLKSPLQTYLLLVSMFHIKFQHQLLNTVLLADGSFVETSSALAARELKRRYDQHIGVGKDVRSPYAITAFVNQHGKQSFRVG